MNKNILNYLQLHVYKTICALFYIHNSNACVCPLHINVCLGLRLWISFSNIYPLVLSYEYRNGSCVRQECANVQQVKYRSDSIAISLDECLEVCF